MRDANYVGIRSLWERDVKNVWTVPNVVAVGPNGKIANGCRALEAVRLLQSMGIVFDEVRRARERVKAGLTVSDELAEQKDRPKTSSRYAAVAIRDTNPIGPAEQKYIQEHGMQAFNQLLETLFWELFPAESGQ